MEKAQIKNREQIQMEVVKKYRLGRSDRSIIIFSSIFGTTGKFHNKRQENAIKKLVKLGLLKKMKTEYGFDYHLTKEGWEVNSKIHSNF